MYQSKFELEINVLKGYIEGLKNRSVAETTVTEARILNRLPSIKVP